MRSGVRIDLLIIKTKKGESFKQELQKARIQDTQIFQVQLVKKLQTEC